MNGSAAEPSPATLTWLTDLVALDTTSATSNLALVDLVAQGLAAHGVHAECRPDPSGDKASLVARIGPDRPGGVVLAAHTDCVPVEGQPWSRDPFVLTRVGSRLHGRGATDMKGFLATVLAAVPALTAAPLQRPVLLVLTYDEELGTLGAPEAVQLLLDTQPRPSAVVVGEPTLMEPVTAHKGVRTFTVEVEGVDGHSSQPQRAANALAAAVRIGAHIDALARELAAGEHDDRFDPPYTTVNLATLRAGQAINIVPRRAELTWEYRPVPADDHEGLVERVERFARQVVLPDLTAATGSGSISIRRDAVARGLAPEPDGAAEALVRRLTGSHAPAGAVPFGTDGGHFQAAGLSTVVCGPGSIEQAHQPDEWIEAGQLAACERMLARLAEELSLA